MLKHFLLALLLTALACTLTSFALAQDSAAPQSVPAGAPPDGHHRHFDAEKRTEMLTRQLKLTPDQQPKVLDILKSERSQMEQVRSDSSLSQDDRRAKIMDTHKASSDQIRGLLDPDQQKKWDEIQSRREQWQGHRHEGQDSGAAPNSSQQK